MNSSQPYTIKAAPAVPEITPDWETFGPWTSREEAARWGSQNLKGRAQWWIHPLPEPPNPALVRARQEIDWAIAQRWTEELSAAEGEA